MTWKKNLIATSARNQARCPRRTPALVHQTGSPGVISRPIAPNLEGFTLHHIIHFPHDLTLHSNDGIHSSSKGFTDAKPRAPSPFQGRDYPSDNHILFTNDKYHRPRSSGPVPGTNLYVGRLSPQVREQDLRALFAQVGEVEVSWDFNR